MNSEMAYYTSVKTAGLRARAFKPLTRQEERYLAARISGLDPKSCNEIAGFKEAYVAGENLENALDFFADTKIAIAAVTRDEVTGMLRESHAKASEVRDEISAARELGKLWGLYESDKVRSKGVTINGDLTVTSNKLEVMSDSQLLEHSGFDLNELVPIAIDVKNVG